jgi:hypothetical protein
MRTVKLFFLAFILVLSCKEETKTDNQSAGSKTIEQVEKEKKSFVLEMDFSTSKSGDFKLMMNNIVVDEFQKKSIIITEKVELTTGVDKIKANFGNNASGKFVINLGNKEPKSVKIEKILISYGDNSIIATKENLTQHFVLNDFVEFDSISGTLVTKKINNLHSPAIVLRPRSLNQLQK